jgi:hypothetical protein
MILGLINKYSHHPHLKNINKLSYNICKSIYVCDIILNPTPPLYWCKFIDDPDNHRYHVLIESIPISTMPNNLIIRIMIVYGIIKVSSVLLLIRIILSGFRTILDRINTPPIDDVSRIDNKIQRIPFGIGNRYLEITLNTFSSMPPRPWILI